MLKGREFLQKYWLKRLMNVKKKGISRLLKKSNKNVTQMNIESIEFNHKEVIAADESEEIITDQNGVKCDKVLHSHNLNLLDRTVSNANFSLMSTKEKDDITNLYLWGGIRGGEYSVITNENESKDAAEQYIESVKEKLDKKAPI